MLINDSRIFSVTIADVESAEGLSFDLWYDPSLIAITSASANTSFPGLEITANIDNEAGWLRILGTSVQQPITATDPTPIVDIAIQAGASAGSGDLLLSPAQYSSNFLPINFETIVNGTLTVLGVPGEPQPPAANFSATPTSGKVPLAVTFADESTNAPTSWSWAFGDGATSTAQHPTHTYDAAGTYTVTLTAANDDGTDTATKTGYITVDALTPPVAAFSATPTSGKLPLAVTFTDESSNAPSSWSWAFGDGATSTAQHPTHTYDAAGIYTVTLTATNADGTDTGTKTDYITVDALTPPGAGFSASPTSGKVPLEVTFADTSTNAPTSWAWTFGDGATSTAQHPVHTYATAGSYTVTLTAANADGSDAEIKTDYITVNALTPPGAAFSATPTSGKLPLEVTFTDESSNAPTSWSWAFGDGATSTAQNPTHVYEAAGTYTVTLTATNADGSDVVTKADSITVEALALPVAAFSATPTSGKVPLEVTFTDESSNAPTSWSWAFGDGATSTEQHPVHTYEAAGTYTVTLTVTNADGSDTAIAADSITVDALNAPVAAFSASPTSGTAPLLVSFVDESSCAPTSWLWDFGDGANATEQNPVHLYETAGTYTVTLRVENGDGSDAAVKTGYITVTAGDEPTTGIPVAAFSATPASGTAPLKVQFVDESTNNPTSWLWAFGDGATSTAQHPSHTYPKTGTYTVTLTVCNAYGGAMITETNLIAVSAKPSPSSSSGDDSYTAKDKTNNGKSPDSSTKEHPVKQDMVHQSTIDQSGSGVEGSPNEDDLGNTAGSVQARQRENGCETEQNGSADPASDDGGIPEQISLHTLLTSFGVFSGTVVFRKFGSPEEFDRMLSYLIKAIALGSVYLAYWMISLALF
ncbi:MAG: PKD domain-containing protein [Methanomicrobiaceae archaeon]|nr:PKD domain-containing protein [Methanomicrobiaceae archaeon]